MLFSQHGLAQSPDDIVRIEEHWELKIKTPDCSYAAPQIANAFAPVKQGDVLYATLNMNHHTFQGDFAEGGLELELWNGEYLLASVRSDKNGVLATNDGSPIHTRKSSSSTLTGEQANSPTPKLLCFMRKARPTESVQRKTWRG